MVAYRVVYYGISEFFSNFDDAVSAVYLLSYALGFGISYKDIRDRFKSEGIFEDSDSGLSLEVFSRY